MKDKVVGLKSANGSPRAALTARLELINEYIDNQWNYRELPVTSIEMVVLSLYGTVHAHWPHMSLSGDLDIIDGAPRESYRMSLTSDTTIPHPEFFLHVIPNRLEASHEDVIETMNSAVHNETSQYLVNPTVDIEEVVYSPYRPGRMILTSLVNMLLIEAERSGGFTTLVTNHTFEISHLVAIGERLYHVSLLIPKCIAKLKVMPAKRRA